MDWKRVLAYILLFALFVVLALLLLNDTTSVGGAS